MPTVCIKCRLNAFYSVLGSFFKLNFFFSFKKGSSIILNDPHEIITNKTELKISIKYGRFNNKLKVSLDFMTCEFLIMPVNLGMILWYR